MCVQRHTSQMALTCNSGLRCRSAARRQHSSTTNGMSVVAQVGVVDHLRQLLDCPTCYRVCRTSVQTNLQLLWCCVLCSADGLSQQFLTRLAKLKAAKDPILAMSATLSLWHLASEDANPCYLASVAAAVLVDQLLQVCQQAVL